MKPKIFYTILAIGIVCFILGFGIGMALNPIDNAMTEQKYTECIKQANFMVDVINNKKNCPISQNDNYTLMGGWPN